MKCDRCKHEFKPTQASLAVSVGPIDEAKVFGADWCETCSKDFLRFCNGEALAAGEYDRGYFEGWRKGHQS